MKHLRLLLITLCFLPSSAKPSDSITASPEIIHTQWYSHAEKIHRRVDIYIPACCRQDTAFRSFPVLYLIHGINGYEGSWEDKGSAADTLESLIASGLCPPTILVMPDCNKWPFKERPTHHRNLWKCIVRYPRLSREHDIELAISDLIDMIDTTYNVSSCAIAGFSDGARIATNVTNIRPDCIHTIGIFSPVLHKEQLPKGATQSFYIYAGTKDIFYSSGRRFHHRLRREGYPHEWIEYPEGHNWHMWRRCLSHFLQSCNPNLWLTKMQVRQEKTANCAW